MIVKIEKIKKIKKWNQWDWTKSENWKNDFMSIVDRWQITGSDQWQFGGA